MGGHCPPYFINKKEKKTIDLSINYNFGGVE
jgi:hypothetical protein